MTYHRAAGRQPAKLTCDKILRWEEARPPREDGITHVPVRCETTFSPGAEWVGVPPRYTAAELHWFARRRGWTIRRKGSAYEWSVAAQMGYKVEPLPAYEDFCADHKPARKPNPTPYGRRRYP